jgi:hypothetical protein
MCVCVCVCVCVCELLYSSHGQVEAQQTYMLPVLPVMAAPLDAMEDTLTVTAFLGIAGGAMGAGEGFGGGGSIGPVKMVSRTWLYVEREGPTRTFHADHTITLSPAG